MIDINAKKENCLARDKEFLSIYNDAFNFMIENRVPTRTTEPCTGPLKTDSHITI